MINSSNPNSNFPFASFEELVPGEQNVIEACLARNLNLQNGAGGRKKILREVSVLTTTKILTGESSIICLSRFKLIRYDEKLKLFDIISYSSTNINTQQAKDRAWWGPGSRAERRRELRP